MHLLQIYFRLWECKIYKNWLKFARVIDKSLLPCFFMSHSVYIVIFLVASFSLSFTELSLMRLARDRVDYQLSFSATTLLMVSYNL